MSTLVRPWDVYPSEYAVIVLDLPIENKRQANSYRRKDDVIYCRLIPECNEVRQDQGRPHNDRSRPHRLAVFGDVLLFHFPAVVGVYGADIPLYIHDTENRQEYAQDQKQYVVHNGLLKVEQFFKFLVQRDTEDKSQFGSRVELPRLDGADGVA